MSPNRNDFVNSYSSKFWLFFIIGVLFNFVFIFFSLESSYDALIHLFFANHYAEDWFNPWEERWYTGFNVMTYPPLVHQLIGLFSLIFGLKGALFAMGILVICIFLSGVYQFSIVLLENKEIAQYAMLFASFSPVFLETLHIFGQLPTLMGMGLLFHSFPFIYSFLRQGDMKDFTRAIVLLIATVCSHHVTPIFGMVFFIAPLIGKAVLDDAAKRFFPTSNKQDSYKKINPIHFLLSALALFQRIFLFGISLLITLIFSIFPYWMASKNDPISQVPIPHGSRFNFLEELSSGLMFFIIPWGITLLFLPYILYRLCSKKLLFFCISFSLLVLLGTGGTTPLPRLMLGENAFHILTFDRFTFWACMISFPIMGELLYRLTQADIRQYFIQKNRKKSYAFLLASLALTFIFFVVFTTALSTFRSLQPEKINPQPIVNFLQQDQHYKWRYLTLGFGDQMAYVSALTHAKMVDGNYHSARKLPELTTRAVERLENSKFKGFEGLGSLQQMLTNSNKYHLKYIFSNDKFYDPLLYFYGWDRLVQLENGIWVWEKNGVSPLPNYAAPAKTYPSYQRLMWGIIPLFSIVLIILLGITIGYTPSYIFKTNEAFVPISAEKRPLLFRITSIWFVVIFIVTCYILAHLYQKNQPHYAPENVVVSYFNHLDFKEFDKAHCRIDPDANQTFDEFMLPFLVTDGLLKSYGKLNNIQTTVIDKSDTKALIEAKTEWISPLQKYHKKDTLEVILRKGKWYLIPEKFHYALPKDLWYTQNKSQFYNTGKRRVSLKKTPHKDVINSPEIQYIQANLVEYNGEYSIVGEIVNMDNYPTFVNITAELYDANNNSIAKYDAQDLMQHRLMPKEKTPFKIDFQAIAWLNKSIIKDQTFDPEYIEEFKFQSKPEKVVLHCVSVYTPVEIYNDLHLQSMPHSSEPELIPVFNSGLKEVTISHALTSLYDAQGRLFWVLGDYSEESVKPQRKGQILFKSSAPKHLNVKKSVLENCFINGRKANISPDYSKKAQNFNPETGYYFDISLVNFIGNE